jgi:glucosylglycerate phosphorylase
MLSLAGVPGLYVHSLLASRNAHELYAHTGRARSLNRGRFQWAQLDAELSDPQHRRRRVLDGFRRLMAVRTRHPAFHPQAPQRLPDAPDQVFAVVRGGVASELLCLQNVADEGVRVDVSALVGRALPDGGYRDALDGGWSRAAEVALEPFDTRWLEVPFERP